MGTSELLSRTQQLLHQASVCLEGERRRNSNLSVVLPDTSTAVADVQQGSLSNDDENNNNDDDTGGGEDLDIRQEPTQKHAVLLEEIQQNVDQLVKSWPKNTSVTTTPSSSSSSS